MEKEKISLAVAVEKVDVQLCKDLLRKGVSTEGVLADGSTPLHLAALNSPGDESFGLLKELLSYFSNPTVKDHEGRTAVHRSCINTKNKDRRNETVGLLLLHGGDILAINNNKRDVLSDIVTLQSKDNIADFMRHWGFLLSRDSIEKAKELAGNSAGVGLGYTDIYETIKQYGSLGKDALLAENKKNTGLPTLFLQVIKGEWQEIIDKAEKEGELAIVLEERYGKLSVLFLALLRGEKKLAKRLLRGGIGLGHVDLWGRTVLHIIVGSQLLSEKEKIKLLDIALEKGCKDIGDKNGDTLVHIATRNNYVSLLCFLKEKQSKRISFDRRNNNGDRPVEIANRYGKTKIVELLTTNNI